MERNIGRKKVVNLSIDDFRKNPVWTWFDVKSKDSNTNIYIACCGEEKVGTVRFDDVDDSVKVSVMLNPDYLNKGLGSEIIGLAVEEYKNKIKMGKTIIAEIRNDNIASIKWAISPKDTFGKLMLFVSNNISKNNDEILINHSIPKKAMLTIIRQFSLLLGFILPNKLKTLFNKKAMQKMKYTGYSYPMEIMQLKNIEYAGMEIPVPFDSEACLQHTYGKDWKTPKKNYIWYEEADNLIKLRMK